MARIENNPRINVARERHKISVHDALKLLEWACVCPDQLRKASLLDIFHENGGFDILHSHVNEQSMSTIQKDFTAN
jgi:hypothetical protein